MNAYVEKEVAGLVNETTTLKKQKKKEFKLRLKWLLNKSVMMKPVLEAETKKVEAATEKLRRQKQQKRPAEPRSLFEGTSYPPKTSKTGGYQYLDDNWINADKPWRNFQTPSATSEMISTYSYQPIQTSVPDFSQMMFTTPPPSFISYQAPTPLLNSLNPLNPVDPSPSLYRQEFLSSSPQIASSPQLPILEASEAELARQKRLMEIEEELQAINEKKMQMQMEAELREREMELAHRQQMMELRERELREREERRHLERRSYNYHQGYPEDYSSSSSSRHQRRSPSSSLYDHRSSSFSSRQIAIEEDTRRHGNERRGSSSSHLKRSGDSYRSSSYNDNRSGRIQPAVPVKRHRGGRYEELSMQEICDDEH
uniref:CCDC66 domain-containing protein n=1 Tax=Caenorhabditis tropicalis TaxID=1561998 RepID=A0A1I7T4T7_9PELO